MSNKRLPDEQVIQVLECLFKKSMGNTETALLVLGKKSKESSVRHIKKVYEKHGNYFGLTLNGEINVEQDWAIQDNTLNALCEAHDWNVSNLAKRLRSAQRANNQLRKVQREVFDSNEGETQSIEDIILRAAAKLNQQSPVKYEYVPATSATPSTLEVLLSDLQIGKVSRYYNTEVAKKALKLYGDGILSAIEERKTKFSVERVVFAMIGDLAEDHSKHGVGSAISTDTGLSEQLHDAIEGIWTNVLQPLAELEIPMDVICVVGNHASSTHKGMGTFKEGRYSYDFVIHKTLQSFCRIAKYDHVTFNIPDGTFGMMTIYGKHAIYEHGYHNPCTEKGMVDQMRKRGAQLQIHPTYWRQGDRHHSTVFGQGEQVLNAAFFGVDTEGLEYSGVLGFNSIPSQTIMFHTQEDRIGYGTVKDIVNIQVAVTDKAAS